MNLEKRFEPLPVCSWVSSKMKHLMHLEELLASNKFTFIVFWLDEMLDPFSVLISKVDILSKTSKEIDDNLQTKTQGSG